MDNGYLSIGKNARMDNVYQYWIMVILSIGKNAWIMVILVLERMHG